MKKLVLSGLLFGSLAMAATSYDVLPYAGYIDYSGSTTKDNGSVFGVYISAFESPWKTELDLEHTTISYNNNTTDLTQNDFTGIVHYYQGYNLDYKLGMHYVDSTDKLTDKGLVFIAGILYYKTLKYNAGVDVYYSDYSNQSTSPGLYQISPKAGINFGNYNSKIGSFYAEGKIDFIKVGHNREENGLKNNYTSIEATLNNYNGAFTTSVSGWIGKRVFAVENSGFIVNNLADEQTGGIKVSESYKIDKASLAKVEYSHTKFKENGNSSSNTFLVSYSYNF